MVGSPKSEIGFWLRINSVGSPKSEIGFWLRIFSVGRPKHYLTPLLLLLISYGEPRVEQSDNFSTIWSIWNKPWMVKLGAPLKVPKVKFSKNAKFINFTAPKRYAKGYSYDSKSIFPNWKQKKPILLNRKQKIEEGGFRTFGKFFDEGLR